MPALKRLQIDGGLDMATARGLQTHRIVSFLPAATEIAYALGLGDQVVGVSHECSYPPAARAQPQVLECVFDPQALSGAEIDRRVRELSRAGRSLYRVKTERLRELAPTLVLAQDVCDVCAFATPKVTEAVAGLEHQPQVVSLDAHTLEDVMEDVAAVGEAAAVPAAGRRLVRDLQQRIETVRRRADRAAERPRVAVLEWLEPLFTAGHWLPQMVEIAGGTEVLGRAGRRSLQMSWEQLRDADPEMLLALPCGLSLEQSVAETHKLASRAGWDRLTAVRAGQVYAAGGHIFSGGGPRLIDALELLATVIHPEIFGPAPEHRVRRVTAAAGRLQQAAADERSAVAGGRGEKRGGAREPG